MCTVAIYADMLPAMTVSSDDATLDVFLISPPEMSSSERGVDRVETMYTRLMYWNPHDQGWN